MKHQPYRAVHFANRTLHLAPAGITLLGLGSSSRTPNVPLGRVDHAIHHCNASGKEAPGVSGVTLAWSPRRILPYSAAGSTTSIQWIDLCQLEDGILDIGGCEFTR